MRADALDWLMYGAVTAWSSAEAACDELIADATQLGAEHAVEQDPEANAVTARL